MADHPERPLTIDPERILNDDPETDEAERRQEAGVHPIIVAALAVAADPTEALRWLVLAYCDLAGQTENPKGALSAGIALMRSWRDAGSVPELFDLAPEAFDLALDPATAPRKK
jgi:hypothetical protein